MSNKIYMMTNSEIHEELFQLLSKSHSHTVVSSEVVLRTRKSLRDNLESYYG